MLKRHGVGEGESELGANFSSLVLPRESGSRSRGLRGARGAVLGPFDAVFDTSCPGNECCAVL
jgi:hypothetical protein